MCFRKVVVANLERINKTMILAIYCGDEDNFRKCRELGFSIFQTYSDHLSSYVFPQSVSIMEYLSG